MTFWRYVIGSGLGGLILLIASFWIDVPGVFWQLEPLAYGSGLGLMIAAIWLGAMKISGFQGRQGEPWRIFSVSRT